MLRFKILEQISQRQFKEGRKITITEISTQTGINRISLSKMVNQRGYSTLTDHVDKLCRYFDCKIEDLLEYIPDEQAEANE